MTNDEEFVEMDEVRVFKTEDGRYYVDIDDLQIALQYEMAENKKLISKSSFYDMIEVNDRLNVMGGYTDIICETLENLKQLAE